MTSDRGERPELNVDLHCHTTASDGSLSPHELCQRAVHQGVDVLAITDHDTVAAHLHLQNSPVHQLKLISGVEFSTAWSGMEIHVVGLNFPLDHPGLSVALRHQASARKKRAELIANKLVKRFGLSSSASGFVDTLHRRVVDQQTASTDGFALPSEQILLGRPHFADWLCEAGFTQDRSEAFKKYLSSAKLGDLKLFWPSMSQAVAWIRFMEGCAVLAHPHKYRLTRTKLRALVNDFQLAGGHALEAVCASQSADQQALMISLCAEFQLTSSRASDFHTPENRWIELGRIPPLPSTVTPVWASWSLW